MPAAAPAGEGGDACVLQPANRSASGSKPANMQISFRISSPLFISYTRQKTQTRAGVPYLPWRLSDYSIYLFSYVEHHHQATRFDVIIGCVVQNVAVQHPLARFTSNKLHIIALARRYQHCILG
jgi:hypothetical protein